MAALPLPGEVDLWIRPPVTGRRERTHDRTFDRWDTSFSATRDLVNHTVGQINDLLWFVGWGRPLPLLPTGSLEDLLIRPFSGDFAQIRGNADACRRLGRGLQGWAENVAALAPVGLLVDWRGEAADAFTGRLVAGAGVASGGAAAVASAAAVFEVLADGCEALAVEVEQAVVRLGTALARLARTAIRRLSGLAGAVSLAVEVLATGAEVITDVLDDIADVVAAVSFLLDLATSTAAWVEDQRARLAQFQAALAHLRDLGRGTAPLPAR